MMVNDSRCRAANARPVPACRLARQRALLDALLLTLGICFSWWEKSAHGELSMRSDFPEICAGPAFQLRSA